LASLGQMVCGNAVKVRGDVKRDKSPQKYWEILFNVWRMLDSNGYFMADIVTNRSRTHLSAWLGLIAMWLIVFVPIVSQLVVSARPQQYAAVACDHMQMGDMQMGNMPMGTMHMATAAGGNADMGHHASKSTMAACGYCDLLATHAAMPAPALVAELVFVLAILAAAPVLSTRFTPTGAFPSGRPRAPPVAF
jgi:hypothetical protein